MLAVVGVIAGCGPRDSDAWTSAAAGPSGSAAMSPLDPKLHLLSVGTKAPAVEAEGWLNGPPLPIGDPSRRLLVVDIWADWCPVCRVTAPGLVRVHERFKLRGVEFVSLTDLPEPMVAGFVEQFGVTWSAGYGAAVGTVQAFGVHRPEQTALGLDIAPVLYLIGPDGRVLWCDETARYRHQDTRVLLSDLEGQIEKALEALH
jgi:thiol-disulfide isomerase/thioredoxin